MFLAKICYTFFVIKFGLCVEFIQENNVNLNISRKTNPELADLISNSTKNLSSVINENVSNDHGASVYRNLHFNDSMEKIQLVKNGAVVKSAFIPLETNVSDEYECDDNQYLFDGKNSDLTNIQKEVKDPAIRAAQNSFQENFIVRNGKKYRIVKVKKDVRNGDVVNNKMQRSFKILPHLLSLLPVKWMTKGEKNEMDLKGIRSDNGTEWSILTSSENPEKNYGNFNRIHSSEKFQKLLNLFTILKFDNGGCYADGIKGTCLHQSECQAKSGRFTATCAGELGVCCYFEKTCGGISNENSTYFVNEGFPDSSTQAPKVCTLTLEKAHPDVKQLRLDFLIFQLKEPTNGTCLHDRLVISGQDMNDNVPDICGANTGQHIYINMEDSVGPYKLNIITVGEYFQRNFRIKVTQVRQEDPLLAPKNCLQYYSEPTGYVQTFNYPHDINSNTGEIFNGYFNNLNYAICIKKLKGFCSVSYENEEAEESIFPSFQLINVDEDGERLLPPKQAGAETFDCPDDYIIMNGIRLCGEKLNDAATEMDYTKNYPVTDTSNGPFILGVKTDAAISGRGFYLKYTQHPCLV